MMPMPRAEMVRTRFNTLPASSTLNMLVGSSRISTLLFFISAFKIFTNCWSDTDMCSIFCSGSIWISNSRIVSRTRPSMPFLSMIPKGRVSSLPTKMFSTAFMQGTRSFSW